MRYLFLLLLSGCSISYPIWHLDEGVADLCSTGQHTYTHSGVTKTFNVYVVDDATISDTCGETRYGPAQACTIDKTDIYVPEHHCVKHVAHEANHVFGNDFVDRG